MRARILEVASTRPRLLGEPYASWSLAHLRSYLLWAKVVPAISKERLRTGSRSRPPRAWPTALRSVGHGRESDHLEREARVPRLGEPLDRNRLATGAPTPWAPTALIGGSSRPGPATDASSRSRPARRRWRSTSPTTGDQNLDDWTPTGGDRRGPPERRVALTYRERRRESGLGGDPPGAHARNGDRGGRPTHRALYVAAAACPANACMGRRIWNHGTTRNPQAFPTSSPQGHHARVLWGSVPTAGAIRRRGGAHRRSPA